MNPPILEFQGVTFSYPGAESPALDNITLQLPRGARTVLLGHNGSGKSTLFLHANGILEPDAGTVAFDGVALSYRRRDIQELRRNVGIVFQHADDQLFSASVAQDISFGPLNLGLDEAQVRTRVAEAARACELEGVLERPTHALSGGEKARAALAGVLAMEPALLLIDEPTSSQDPRMRRQIFRIFRRLHEQGKTIMLATHNVEIAQRWADYVVILESGRVLAADRPQAIFADRALMRQTGMDQPWYNEL